MCGMQVYQADLGVFLVKVGCCATAVDDNLSREPIDSRRIRTSTGDASLMRPAFAMRCDSSSTMVSEILAQNTLANIPQIFRVKYATRLLISRTTAINTRG